MRTKFLNRYIYVFYASTKLACCTIEGTLSIKYKNLSIKSKVKTLNFFIVSFVMIHMYQYIQKKIKMMFKKIFLTPSKLKSYGTTLK